MGLKIHIHRSGVRVRTVDLSGGALAAQYDELIERLMAIIDRQSKTHDDGQVGHPFYGNQYTDVVLGPKPTEAKSKGVKNQVHELISSGHPFSIDELQKITGAKLKQQLFNAFAELKKGKGLQINKTASGHYQVVKADGTPAGGIAQEATQKAEPIQTPAEPEKTAGSPSPGAPSDPFDNFKLDPPPTKPGISVPPTPMSKAEADDLYKKTLHGKLDEIKESMDNFDIDEAGEEGTEAFTKKLALDFKQAKAEAMAQWATNTSGQLHQAKPVTDVFPEDVQLVYMAHLDQMPHDEKMKTWKEATAAAKSKAAKKAAEPPAPAKPAVKPSPALAAVPTGPGVFKPPEVIVPDDHKHIDVSDFTGPDGYVKSIADLHKKLHDSAKADAVANKVGIQAALDKRLKASHHFQAMEAQHLKSGKSHYGSLSASLISSWASSSGDHNPVSVAAQLAVRDAFKMNPEHIETKAFHYLQSHSEEQTHADAAKSLGIDVSSPEKLASFQEGMKDFALAQYQETQEHLAKMGVKELYLIRGMKFGAGSADAKHVKVKLQPASSFTTNHGTAKSFAGGHSLFAVKVPASQVLGSFCTGYGCTGESEVVVLGHENLHAFQVGTGKAESATAMASHIKSTHGGASVPKPQSKGISAKVPHYLELSKEITGAPSSVWMQKAEAAVATGGVEAVENLSKDFEEYKAANGLLMPNTGHYLKALKEWATKQSPPAPNKVKKAANSFKPTGVPSKPAGVKSSWATVAKKAAEKGDLEGLKAAQESLNAIPGKYPASKKYVQDLIDHVEPQWKAHQAKLAEQPVSMVLPSKNPPQKNAYYYKKLKEKVLGHPLHTEATYTGLKASGHSNEKILAYYEQQHEQTYGVKKYG